MATYKIPQNVEAEDKLLGPFTFKQFIFLLMAAFAALVTWLLWRINPWVSSLSIPFILLFGFLGIYHREDQPVEVYLVAALNYLFKPRRRKWSQEGLVETVRLTAPKVKLRPELKRLSSERGQLKTLANIMDTRGWAIKRPELTEPLANQYFSADDRLAMPDLPSSATEPLEVHAYDDPLDPLQYGDADKFSDLAQTSSKQAKAQAIAKMEAAINTRQPTDAPAAVVNSTDQVERVRSDTAKNLAMNDVLRVSEIAKQAQKIPKGELPKGIEIDLPNPGE